MPSIVIKIPMFSTSDFKRRVAKSLDRRGRRNENILLRTTQYFETVKPVFISEVEKIGNEWSVKTGPQDDESGEIWSYLDEGTEVRYATMTGDFTPGTEPGTFETGPATGGKQFVSTKVPQEGIEARNWTKLLAEREQPVFAGEMQTTIKNFIDKWGSRISRFISG